MDLAVQQLVVIELASAGGEAARLPGAALQESGVAWSSVVDLAQLVLQQLVAVELAGAGGAAARLPAASLRNRAWAWSSVVDLVQLVAIALAGAGLRLGWG